MKQKVHNLCEICSDKGIGRHFGAITCESCKIFFRRNALKDQVMDCTSDGKCKINPFTRKLCTKCRLNKCFAVGMRKELIRNDREREERRQLVEENRRKRKLLNKSQNTSSESNESSNPASIESTISTISSDSIDSFLSEIIGCVLDVSDEDLGAQIMEIENYVNYKDSDQNIEALSARQLLDDIHQKSQQMSVIPMFKELTDYNGFKQLEINRIAELLGSSQIFDYPSSRHFGAIACELCKAFFRRNALKNKVWKCLSDGKCKITPNTKTLCKTCRLHKCFAVGMRKELILNDEEREQRRQLLEENRRKRKALNESQNTSSEVNVDSLDAIIGCVSDDTDEDLSAQIMEIENYVNSEHSDHRRHFGAITCESCKIFFKRNGNKNQEFIRNHEEREEKRQLVEENRRKRKQLNISQNSYPESNKSSNPSSMMSTISSDCGVSDSFFNDIIGCVLDVNERELREQVIEIENYVNNEDLDQSIETLSARQLLENINQKSRQMAVIPMFKELTDYNGLNELETNKMTELLGASKIF
ncbi:unnamed protein product, partial [Oppiella nova]